jgi:hypothetical protein
VSQSLQAGPEMATCFRLARALAISACILTTRCRLDFCEHVRLLAAAGSIRRRCRSSSTVKTWTDCWPVRRISLVRWLSRFRLG